MAYYDPNKDYSRNPVLDFLDAGAHKTGAAKVDQIADMEALLSNTGINIQEKYGAVTAEEAEQMRQQAAQDVEAGHKENMKSVDALSLSNTVTNSIGIVSSVAAGVGLANVGKAGGALAKMGGNVVTQTLAKGAGAAMQGIGKFAGSHLLISAGVVAAPTLATQFYTHAKTDEANTQWNQTLNTLQASYECLTDKDAELSDAVREQTSGWTKSYEAGSAELVRQLEAGEITQAEYDTRYEQFVEEQNKALEELQAGHAETAKYITEHGVAYAADEYIADHGYDIDRIDQQSQYIANLNKNNPDAYEAAKTALETRAQLSTGSAFTDFLANMNATILHYLPGAAYVEAAAVKVADMAADFLANKIPVLSSVLPYQEKHKGESISEIAKSICTDAEARYELSHSTNDQLAILQQGQDAPSTGTDPAKDQPGDTGPEPSYA